MKPFVRWTDGEWKGWACQTARCRNRQAKHALAVTKSGKGRQMLFLPLPKQVEAIQAILAGKHRWMLYGGARGGGKSMLMRWIAYMLCLEFEGFQAVLLRRTYPELEKSHMRRMGAEAKLFGGDFVPSARPPVMKFPNGSVLELGHCQDPQDVENYLSAEYNLVLPDELGTFEEDMILKIGSSARLYHPKFKPCIVGSTNPGSVWVRDRWITQEVDLERFPNYDPKEYFFIQSKLDDNPYPDPEYERFLNALDPDTRAAWRDGSWDVFEGQYFKEFRREKHIRELDIPSEIPCIGGLDWGFASHGVHLWAVLLPDGHIHIVDEFRFRETLAADAANRILQMSHQPGRRLISSWADPSMWIRSGQSGESIAETFQRVGMSLQRANHERINGWQRLRHWLSVAPDGVPWLTIDPRCKYLARSLPTLIHDDKIPEDIDTTGNDHAADALRYLLMGRPAPMQSRPSEELGEVGRMFREAREGQASQVLGADAVRR